jgi:hypothetical protein
MDEELAHPGIAIITGDASLDTLASGQADMDIAH